MQHSGPNHKSVRHSREDALSETEFEKLYDASFQLKPDMDLESRLILMLGGRLGLRRGEIAHLEADWIDWRQSRIDIPPFEPCDRARDGGPCASCRQHAQQKADHNEGVTYEDAIANAWGPKTDMSVRSVPFQFSSRAQIVIEEYFEKYEKWMYGPQAINRRVNRLAELAGFENCYPHALRATAASYLAGRGMSTLGLQSMLGWAQSSTAEKYVARSADNTARELEKVTG